MLVLPMHKQDCRKIAPRNILIIVLLLITIIAVAAAIWAVWFRTPAEKTPADMLEPSQVPLSEELGEKLEQPKGGGAVNLTYAPSVTIDLSDKQAELYFENPSRSNQDVLVSLQIEGNTVFQTGRITPGNLVKNQPLELDIAERLQEGIYDGEFMVFFFDPAHNELAMLETVLSDIVITVMQ